MKLIDIINMKVESEQELKKLKRAVLMTKWFNRFDISELTIDVLEDGYKRIAKKYSVKITYVIASSEKAWGFVIRDIKTGAFIYNVSAKTLFESLCKTILVMYGYIEKEMPFYSGIKTGV